MRATWRAARSARNSSPSCRELTGGAEVAAATHLVGSADLGGSWTLDASTAANAPPASAASAPFTQAALASFNAELDTHTPPTVTAGANLVYELGRSTPLTLDPGLTINAPDSGDTLIGATVAFAPGSFAAGDTLTFTNTANITGSYDSSTGTLTLSGTDTVEDYQAALESVGFSTTDARTGRLLQIGWTVNDGNTTNGTSRLAESDVETKTGLSLAAGATATFAAGGPAVVLDSGLRISDQANSLASATVTIEGAITGDTLTINGLTSGTLDNGLISFAFAGSTLTLTGQDTAAAYQNELETVKYSFTPATGDPTAGGADQSRTVAWTATDGVETGSGTSTLDVHAMPTLAGAAAGATFTLNQASVTLSPNVTLSDPSSSTLVGATVAITGGTFVHDGDVLAATTVGTAIAASYNQHDRNADAQRRRHPRGLPAGGSTASRSRPRGRGSTTSTRPAPSPGPSTTARRPARRRPRRSRSSPRRP